MTKETPCKDRRYEVTVNDLPLSCPSDDMRLWDAHPKVYLPLEEGNTSVVCPYCDAEYVLVAEK